MPSHNDQVRVLRPRQNRQAARIVLLAAGEVLLVERYDDGKPDCRWWSTPGGGIESDETPLAAAIRELYEETGYQIDPSLLRGPVATRLATCSYTDRINDQYEWYFVAELATKIEVRPHAMTEREKRTTGDWAWFALDDFLTLDHWYWDDILGLLDLYHQPERWPVDYGWELLGSMPAPPPAEFTIPPC